MKKKVAFTLLLCLSWAMTAFAQNTIESIRKEYQEVHEWIARMEPNEDGGHDWPPEYFDVHVVQNLPATGPHDEKIRMFYGEKETEEDLVYPPHYLRFTTAKYNFAAREFYEEYLYDNKGQVMFIYAISPDVGDDLTPYELRMWFDGERLLRFTAKKAEGEYENLRKATYKETYSGKTIPELYQREAGRCQQRARRFITMFDGIDENTYL